MRNSKEVKVFIPSRNYGYNENWLFYKEQAINSDDRTRQLIQYDERSDMKEWGKILLNLYARCRAMDVMSKNRLCQNWLELKKEQGWSINIVEKRDDNKDIEEEDPKKLIVLDGESEKSDEVTLLLESPDITPQTYKKLKESRIKTKSDFLKIKRYKIQQIFNEPISKDNIGLYDADFHKDLWKYKEYTGRGVDRAEIDIEERNDDIHLAFSQNLTDKQLLLERIFTTCGLQDFGTSVQLRSDQMGNFISFVKQEKDMIESLLRYKVKKDVQDKPVEVLTHILKRVGISLKSKRIREGSGRVRIYQINEDQIKSLEKYASK